MDRLHLPALTASAHRWLQNPDPRMDRIQRALLSMVDGHRSVVELESVARAMRLPVDALEELRQNGLIEFAADQAADH
jgi:hypothetical protein